VLWVIPFLLTRLPLREALPPVSGTVITAVLGALFLLQAIANLAAARGVAHHGPWFRAAAVAAATGAGAR
jgi:hypothetical protein